MNIFEELRKEHDTQRELIQKIQSTHGESDIREHLWKEMKESLESHAAAEERCFYKYLIEHELTQEKARHSMAEHKDLDDKIEEIDNSDMSTSAWLMNFKSLAELLVHHLNEEEKEYFPVAGKVLSEDEKEKLAQEYRQYYEVKAA